MNKSNFFGDTLILYLQYQQNENKKEEPTYSSSITYMSNIFLLIKLSTAVQTAIFTWE